jgi:hypothetical protein
MEHMFSTIGFDGNRVLVMKTVVVCFSMRKRHSAVKLLAGA